MTVRTYGFAYPLKYEDVKPGMLISAVYGERHVLGIAFAGDREPLLAIFDDGGAQDPRPPYVIDVSDSHGSLILIPGDLEFEPSEDHSFDLLPQRRVGIEGFVITSTGTVGLAFTHRDFGQPKFMMIEVGTGNPLQHSGQIAVLPSPRLFVVQEGRIHRREVIAKQAR